MGFLFLVLYPPPPPPPPPRPFPHSLTHSSLSHSLHSLTHTHSLTLTHSHSLTHTHSLTPTHSLTLTHSHSLTHSTHSHSLAALGAPQGVGCTPWRPLVSAALPVAFAWQAQHLVLCKGSDVRPGVPWSPLLCRWLLRGRRSTWCSARGRMYAPASLGLQCSAAGFCVAGAALGALQGVGCTPWRPLVSAALPVAFAWQAQHLVLCKGSDVRAGVLGLRWSVGGFCVAGVGQCALSRGRMYALASLGLRCSAGGFCVAGPALGALQGVGCTPWRPLVSAALPVGFAWQAQHLVLCKGCVAGTALGALQGVGCTPWRPLVLCRWLLRDRRSTWCSARGPMYAALPVALAWQAQHLVLCKGSDVRPGVPWSPLLRRWLLRSRRGTWCSARGPMYALASLGLRCSAGGFCMAGAALGAPQGVGCTPWRPLVSGALPLAFAWQAQHLVLCKGSDVRPGVPWSPLLCRWLLRGRRGTWCSARGRMYALASLGLRCSAAGFCVAGAALGALQGVRCTPWRPLVSAALPVAFAWQAQHLVLCKGSDVRSGVPWSPLLCRWLLRGRRSTWCSARGPMYALVSLGLRWLLRGRRGTWCSARGQMYALASFGLRCSAGGFCVAGAALGALQGVGCTPWRPLVSAALPVAFAWQGRHSLTHSLSHSLTHLLNPSTHSLTPSLTHSLYLNIHTPLHHSFTRCGHIKLTHHHRSITLILPLPFLLFYAQSKSKEVGNMWGYPVL